MYIKINRGQNFEIFQRNLKIADSHIMSNCSAFLRSTVLNVKGSLTENSPPLTFRWRYVVSKYIFHNKYVQNVSAQILGKKLDKIRHYSYISDTHYFHFISLLVFLIC